MKSNTKKRLLEKARKPKVKVDKLKNGIVDHNFVLPIGSKYVVQRERNERRIVSYCILKDVAENGDVTMWDESVTQFFSFNIYNMEGIKVKIED